MKNRTAIIVSPYFVPSMLANIHRARHLAKHLPVFGWTPIILCVDEAYHEENLDTDLAALIPSTVEIIRTRALPARLTRAAGIGEISLRAWWPLRKSLFQLLKSRRPSVVLITGSPYFPMLFAQAIKRRFGTSVVLDFQDPWVSASGTTSPILSKAWIARRLAELLEPRALRGADYVTSVSEIQNEALAAHYPWLDASRMAAVAIGGDPDDFSVSAQLASDRQVSFEPGFIHLSYIGTFWPTVTPSVRVLLAAFRRLRTEMPEVGRRIRLNFIGTSAQPNGALNYQVKPLAEAEGVSDAIREIPQRVPYLSALSAMVRSDGLLLIGSNEPHYNASKIYPSLMSGRPFLSLFHRASQAHSIVCSAGGGCNLSFENLEELNKMQASLANGLKILATANDKLGKANPAVYAPYEARAIAGRYAEIFDLVSK